MGSAIPSFETSPVVCGRLVSTVRGLCRPGTSMRTTSRLSWTTSTTSHLAAECRRTRFLSSFRRTRRALFGDYKFAGTYDAHPDPNQETFFFGLVRDALDDGAITENGCTGYPVYTAELHTDRLDYDFAASVQCLDMQCYALFANPHQQQRHTRRDVLRSLHS